MRVLVTGSTGFLGREVVQRLEQEGHEVHRLTRREVTSPRELRVDLTKAEDFARLDGLAFDAVVHSAAIIGGAHFSRAVAQVNEDGTRRLVEWAKQAKCSHFVQVSSVAAYGLRASGQGRDDLTTKRSTSPLGIMYMRSKARAEILVEESGLGYTTLRFPTIIGAGDTLATPAIASALVAGPMPYAGPRDRPFSLVGVHSAARIIARVLELGPLGGAYNAADGDVVWSELVAEYAKRLGVALEWRKKSPLGLLLSPDRGYQFLLVNAMYGAQFPSARLWERLGIPPATDWRETVGEAAKAFKEAHRGAEATPAGKLLK